MQHEDMDLVQEFATRNSEEAFATLVSRHVGLVHSAALRRVRDPHVAEEITQSVFIILARKAASLGPKTILPGWLYRTANYVSMAAIKTQRRREQREQETFMQRTLEKTEPETRWEQLSPLLDGAMAQMRAGDRDVLVLRFFQKKQFKEVGDALGLEESTARKRVERALEKLRIILSRRGIALSAVVLASVISANSVQATPVALAQSVTTVAVVKGATASGSTLVLLKGALKIMAWAKAKTVVLAGTCVLLAAGITSTIVFRNEIRYHFTLAEGRSALARHDATPLDLRRQGGVFEANNSRSPWDTVPTGFQVFDHVPLQIGSLITLWGGRNAAGGGWGGPPGPEAVEGIEVNQTFEALYVYHTALFASPDNTPVCAVVLHYEDGSSATNQLLYGADILEWAGKPGKRANTPKKPNYKTANDPTGPNSRLAWLGGTFTPGENRPLRFCLTALANPNPSAKVDAIDLYSCKSPSAPCIMAMTVGKAGLMKQALLDR